MKASHSLDSAKQEVIKAGYTVSSASWEDEHRIYACSVESAPGTCGHPKFEVEYRKLSATEQIVIYARHATGLVRLARNSRCPGKLVELALVAADKLIHVARTIPDEREALKAWRSGVEVQNMVKRSFGPMFIW